MSDYLRHKNSPGRLALQKEATARTIKINITQTIIFSNYSALKKINSYLPRQGLPEKDFDCSFWQFA